jgi:hypothetical protein
LDARKLELVAIARPETRERRYRLSAYQTAIIYAPDGDINEDATANTNEIIESFGIIGAPLDPWLQALQLEWPA